MVSTRRSSRNDQPVQESSDHLSSREKRRRRNEALRSKSTGVGIEISSDEKRKQNALVFTDQTVDQPEKLPNITVATATDDSDDDGPVEEITSNVAKDQADARRKTEILVARETKVLVKKKRKRKNRLTEEGSDDDDDLDDQFFEKLEEEKKAEAVKAKEQRTKTPKGRHTTFVASDEGRNNAKPKRVGRNMQVVVLKDPQSIGSVSSAIDTFTTSKSSLIYSRSELEDGSDTVTEKQLQKAKKMGKAPQTTNWKRSRKMNRLLLPGAKRARRNEKEASASSFMFKI